MTRNMTGSDVNLRDDDKCDKAEEVSFHPDLTRENDIFFN